MEDMEQDSKQCPHCGETIKALAKKCRFCGQWLNEVDTDKQSETLKTKPCPTCGENVPEAAKVCKSCGVMFEDSSNSNTNKFNSTEQKLTPDVSTNDIVETDKDKLEQDTKQCPYCGETIKAIAQKCKFCGQWLNKNKTNRQPEAPKTKNCPACGEEILAVAKKCKHCGEMLEDLHNLNAYNKYSEQQKELPAELQKFNWGAFLWNWVWGIGNKSYLTFWIFAAYLVAFIPVVGWLAPVGLSIWFGIKGNEWAWNNKQWKSIKQFNRVQKTWVLWGIIVSLILAIIFIAVGENIGV